MWVRETLVDYHLDFASWTKRSACTEPQIKQLRTLARQLSPADQQTAGLIFDEAGELIAHSEPMLVVSLEKP